MVGVRRPNSNLTIIIYTSAQLRPSLQCLARPTFGGLWSQNCLKEGHVLWVNMFCFFLYMFSG